MQKGMEDKVVRADCGPVTPVRTPKTWLESHSLIEAFFAATSHALECNRDKGGGNFQPDDVAKLNIPIYLILLWLFVDIRTPRRRRSKIGEDESTTPLWKGFLSARVEGAILHASTRPPEGCSRPL